MYQIIISVLTAIVIAVTFGVGHLLVAVRSDAYYCMMIPLAVAELVIGLTLLWQCFARSRGWTMQLGLIAALYGYLGFTLLMIVPFAMDAAFKTMLVAQLLAGCVTVVVIGSFLMAGIHQAQPAEHFAAKKMFKLELMRFQQEHAAFLREQPVLDAKITALSDAFRYASDSVPGGEDADDKIRAVLTRLHAAGGEGNAADCLSLAEELLTLQAWRQNVMKELR